MSVKQEVAKAYADSRGESGRILGFRASEPVNAQTAVEIMKEFCPDYNSFDPEALGLFPDDCQIFLAREGSVCIYVRPGEKPLPTREELDADEHDVQTKTTFADEWHSADNYEREDHGGYEGEVRIWWD